ncbi:hypothetical protein GCM10020227_03720 [Streptomyces flavovirens]
MVAQTSRGEGGVRVEYRREGLHIRGVQPLGVREGVHQAVDLAVHSPELHSERLELKGGALVAERPAGGAVCTFHRLIVEPPGSATGTPSRLYASTVV